MECNLSFCYYSSSILWRLKQDWSSYHIWKSAHVLFNMFKRRLLFFLMFVCWEICLWLWQQCKVEGSLGAFDKWSCIDWIEAPSMEDGGKLVNGQRLTKETKRTLTKHDFIILIFIFYCVFSFFLKVRRPKGKDSNCKSFQHFWSLSPRTKNN